jgi:hypothetical protein
MVFMTEKREIGLAPVKAKVGDIVVCLKRATVQFFFRRKGGLGCLR